MSLLILAGLLMASSNRCGANELIHFSNGFSMQADSHRQQGTIVQLVIGSGTLEFPAEQIAAIENLPAIQTQLPPIQLSASPAKPEVVLSEAALAGGIDAFFVRSVAQVESGLRQTSVSRTGAIGLMQLMPATARELRVDPSQLSENARGGVQYLRTLLLRYHGDSALALAAYNAGPGAVQKYKGIPPYRETQHYILAVLKEYNRQLQQLRPHSEKQITRAGTTARAASKPSATD